MRTAIIAGHICIHLIPQVADMPQHEPNHLVETGSRGAWRQMRGQHRRRIRRARSARPSGAGSPLTRLVQPTAPSDAPVGRVR